MYGARFWFGAIVLRDRQVKSELEMVCGSADGQRLLERAGRWVSESPVDAMERCVESGL